jgi:CBS-domain-containing membrane protein
VGSILRTERLIPGTNGPYELGRGSLLEGMVVLSEWGWRWAMNDLRSERQLAETVEWGIVATAMSRKFVLLSPSTRVEDALIWSEGKGAAWGVVVEDGRIVGSVAVSDLSACWDVSARAASAWWNAPARLGRAQLHVADVSTTETQVGAAESLIVALLRMDDAGADHLIVVEEDGRPVGVISRRDAIAALSRAASGTPDPPRVLAAEA